MSSNAAGNSQQLQGCTDSHQSFGLLMKMNSYTNFVHISPSLMSRENLIASADLPQNQSKHTVV